MDRRRFLHVIGLGGVAAALAPTLAACKPHDSGPLGPLGVADANGLRLPTGFSSRVIATSGFAVGGTGYVWPGRPDGGAAFKSAGGGWIYVANSELTGGDGGASMVRFDSQGTVVEAGRILGGTRRNCSGGATTWGTWLSCEEIATGRVWECDPTGASAAIVRPAMGRFNHEAAYVDATSQAVYLSEDQVDGALYRFVPVTWGDLSAGRLDVLTGSVPGTASWVPVPDPSAATVATAHQVPGTTIFNRGEGLTGKGSSFYLATSGDDKIWSITPNGATATVSIAYDRHTSTNPIIANVDNMTTTGLGDRWVAEDGSTLEICRMAPDGSIEPALQLTGVTGTGLTGPAFSPNGTRLYFSAQDNPGRTFEVTGPFPRWGP